jgi:hypothetical protein
LQKPVKIQLQKNWVISKSFNNSSSISIYQAHEQNNAIVKGSGGAIGLTENPVAFKRWMVAGPEMARALQEFEDQISVYHHAGEKVYEHHDQGLATQKSFQRHVNNLVSTFSEMDPLKMNPKYIWCKVLE